MTSIKPYVQKLTVELKDGTKLYSDRTLEEFEKYLSLGKDVIKVQGVIFNRYEFKKAYINKINSMEDYILSLPKDQQNKVREREKAMKNKVGKGFKNIGQIKKYLQNNY